MRNFVYRIGGYDPEVVYYIKTADRNHIFTLSLLLFIPMTTSFFAAFLYLNSIKLDLIFIISGSLIWALMVFSIDRAIFMYKNPKDIYNSNKYGLLALRLTFAIIVAYTISDQLNALIHRGQIKEHTALEREKVIKDATKSIQDGISKLQALKVSNENELLAAKKDLKDYNELVTAEANGVKKTIRGFETSGVPNSSNKVNGKYKEYVELATKTGDNIAGINKKLKDIDKDIAGLTTQLSSEKARISNGFADDYSTASKTLRDMAFKSFGAFVDYVFWFLLFVIIDVIAIMLKAFQPYGMYDGLNDAIEAKYQRHTNEWRESDEVSLDDFFDKIKEDYSPVIVGSSNQNSMYKIFGFIGGAGGLALVISLFADWKVMLNFLGDIIEFIKKVISYF